MNRKNLIFAVVFLFCAQVFSSCAGTVVLAPKTKVSTPKKVPPGQMKKATGSKSAKPYAPGQQKKKHK